MKLNLNSLVLSGSKKLSRDLSKDSWDRIKCLEISLGQYFQMQSFGEYLGVTEEFINVLNTFPTEEGELPAGFRPEFVCTDGQCIRVDLVRDISYEKNGRKRPTNILFSVDSANPYEIEPFKNIVANLTCNPFIVYSQFINNPEANIGNKFKDIDEVMTEIGRILGPGCDISVEVNNPFADFEEIMEEVARFEEILTKYRLVVKIPHTGPINRNNIDKLISGELGKSFDEGSISDNLYGHNLAYKLQEKGYRVNFTLMFEPYQTALALQVRPYFINTFIKARYLAHLGIRRLLKKYEETGNKESFDELKSFLVKNDIISVKQASNDESWVLEKARWILNYSMAYDEDYDGLDSTRHSLRLLRQANLPDTRLIICSLGGEQIYPNVDKMLMEPEFQDMTHRVIITAPPADLAKYTSAPGVLTYQRMFLGAVN